MDIRVCVPRALRTEVPIFEKEAEPPPPPKEDVMEGSPPTTVLTHAALGEGDTQR